MKQEIIGYVTALINTYNNKLEKVPSNNFQEKNLNEIFIKDLDGLLDFVDDISEEERVYTVKTFEENRQLRRRVNELEESCEGMCEVEKNLHRKIDGLVKENEQLIQKLENGGTIDG